MHRNRARHWCVLFVLVSTIGCKPADVAVEIPFVAEIDGAPFSCSTTAAGFAPSDLRFYVHGVELLDRAGKPTALTLNDDGVWQNGSVALLDFETGADNCSDGTRGTNRALRGRLPAGEYSGLRFVIGVPFALNHADPAEAAPPLNLGRLHWGWQAGYKFLRFEGARGDGGFRLHIGSTGCEGTIGKISNCTHPNRATIELSDFHPGQSVVHLDLGPLLRTATAPAETVVSCMSEVDDPDCRAPFVLFGLDPDSGEAGGPQKLFTARAS